MQPQMLQRFKECSSSFSINWDSIFLAFYFRSLFAMFRRRFGSYRDSCLQLSNFSLLLLLGCSGANEKFSQLRLLLAFRFESRRTLYTIAAEVRRTFFLRYNFFYLRCLSLIYQFGLEKDFNNQTMFFLCSFVNEKFIFQKLCFTWISLQYHMNCLTWKIESMLSSNSAK